eukprot:1363896-Amorphochlora_amoeboformis.AAC.1
MHAHIQKLYSEDSSVFPSIPLPPLNFDDVGGPECVKQLLGGDDGRKVIISRSGSLNDLLQGVPMRMVRV